MTNYEFTPMGVCSKRIEFALQDGRIHALRFTAGCPGNLKAISRLCEGREAREIADVLRGNLCRSRGTSCADQLAQALDAALSGKLPEAETPKAGAAAVNFTAL
ncbi:MAG: TIGR03905 family TSCPD domain-containing protein [Succinivibrio sp.]|nr:TIGR03905 family TSCPD domain-containing protein [Succinivibrio sp.]